MEMSLLRGAACNFIEAHMGTEFGYPMDHDRQLHMQFILMEHPDSVSTWGFCTDACCCHRGQNDETLNTPILNVNAVTCTRSIVTRQRCALQVASGHSECCTCDRYMCPKHRQIRVCGTKQITKQHAVLPRSGPSSRLYTLLDFDNTG